MLYIRLALISFYQPSFLSIPGSLQIQKLGVLSELSSNGRMLYPVGYQ